ncbi:MAG: response regulator [Cyclobacteriaceae bacterium]
MGEKYKITILYVDDEEINLLLFERTFSQKYNVIVASSGEEGLDALKNYKDEIDVVISDMRMSEMDGIEFITLAKDEYPSKVYFILTGFVFGEEIEEALKTKLIQNSFSKPFDRDQIESEIMKVISS